MITLDRGPWGSKSFDTAAEFSDYLERYWTFYSQILPHMAPFGNWRHHLDTARGNSAAHLQNPEQLQYLPNAISGANQLFANGAPPPHDSVEAQLIQQYSFDPQLAAAIAENLASGVRPNSGQMGVLIAAAFKYPKLTGKDGFTFAKSTGELTRRLDAAVSNADTHNKQFLENSQLSLKNAHTEHELKQQEIEDKAVTQRNEFADQWEQLKKRYDSDLSFRAPLTYWNRQKDNHTTAARIAKDQFRGVSVFATLVAVVLLGTLWTTGLSRPGDLPITIWVLSGAVLALAFWAIRLFSRLFLSREHLARDAEERVTMIETYLALIEHGRVKDDDLKFVLASIFRPTEDGLVKDDSLPSPLLDLFQQGRKS
jgi:hypothetical protein